MEQGYCVQTECAFVQWWVVRCVTRSDLLCICRRAYSCNPQWLRQSVSENDLLGVHLGIMVRNPDDRSFFHPQWWRQ